MEGSVRRDGTGVVKEESVLYPGSTLLGGFFYMREKGVWLLGEVLLLIHQLFWFVASRRPI